MSEETKRGYYKVNTTYTTEDNRQYADYWASYSARTGLMPSEAIDAVVFMSNVARHNDQSLKVPDEPHVLFEVLAESFIANEPTALRLIEAVRGEQKIDHTYKKLIGHKAKIFQEHTGEPYGKAISRHLEKRERGSDLEKDEPDYDAYYTFWKPFTERAKALPLAKRLEEKRSLIIEQGAEAFKLWLAKQGSKAKPPLKIEMAHPLHYAPVIQIPNDPASVFVMSALAQKLTWETNENECHKFAQRGKSLAIYRPEDEIPDDWANFRESVLQTLESRFMAMKGDLVADVADILFWHWLSNNRPAYAGITLSQILEYRGVKPRPNVIEEHWQAMRDVRSIKLRGGGIESESLFHISAAQPNLFGATEPPKLETVYRYHPGYFLSEAIQRDAFFLAYYARNVWQLDYYRDANAKRLARVLRAEWRRNAESYLPNGKPRYRTWRALLDESGIDHNSATAQKEPRTFIKAIENEVEKLYQNEFIRECAPVIYHPDDREKREGLPRKGALVAWLALRTHIAPAADITDALTKTATHRLAHREKIKALAENKKKAPKRQKKAV
jgi:hypothetical protein